MDRLMFALLSDSIAEVRRVPSRCGNARPLQVETLRRHFTVWERGVLLNAACFLVDLPRLPIDLPQGALTVAHAILDAERRGGHVLDLIAAAVAGGPWRSRFTPICLVCGRLGTWRKVLTNAALPLEAAWRYERPENHLPLCRRCIARLAFRTFKAQYELAQALWGPRFDALDAWHQARSAGSLPEEWDPGSDPLWPAEYGGATWASGSGHVCFAEPRVYYGVARGNGQRETLERFLGRERAAELTGQEPGTEIDREADLEPSLETELKTADFFLPRIDAVAESYAGALP